MKEGREAVKIRVCLFTCLTIRTIHLEWVMNLTPDKLSKTVCGEKGNTTVHYL